MARGMAFALGATNSTGMPFREWVLITAQILNNKASNLRTFHSNSFCIKDEFFMNIFS